MGMTLTGVVAAAESDADGPTWATAFVGSLPLATANLRSEQVTSNTDGVSYAIKLAIDFFAGMAVTILMIED